MTAPATTRVLLDGEPFKLGEFRCRPGHPLWRELNDNIGPRPHLVFPQTSVYIDRGRSGRVLATPNHVVFYASHELYRRELHDPRGDVSLFVTVAPPVFEEIVSAGCRSLAASDPETYLRVNLLSRLLKSEAQPDRLLVDDVLTAVVARAARTSAGSSRACRPTTRNGHRRLAEATKEVLARRLAEPLSLRELARDVNASPFHLVRIFRHVTGFTVHDYRIHLRLRRALELLAEPELELTWIAHTLGFSSLSHFSGSFRRVFGVPPSGVRRASPHLRRIVEARLAARS